MWISRNSDKRSKSNGTEQSNLEIVHCTTGPHIFFRFIFVFRYRWKTRQIWGPTSHVTNGRVCTSVSRVLAEMGCRSRSRHRSFRSSRRRSCSRGRPRQRSSTVARHRPRSRRTRHQRCQRRRRTASRCRRRRQRRRLTYVRQKHKRWWCDGTPYSVSRSSSRTWPASHLTPCLLGVLHVTTNNSSQNIQQQFLSIQ